MHAASVHPEPGSNSRKIVYETSFRTLDIFLRAWLLFTFCLSSILFQRIHEICSCTYFYALYFSHCCSIFNDRTIFRSPSLPLFATAWLLYHNVFALSIPFLKFFQNFFSVSTSCRCGMSLSRRLVYYTTPLLSLSIVSFSKSRRLIQSTSAFLYKKHKKEGFSEKSPLE